MLFKKILLLFFTNVFILNLPAQEKLLDLHSNPLKSKYTIPAKATDNLKEFVLELPFFEDFSYNGPYPDHTLWADSFVFVNSSYHVHPVTVGVATFDALDQYGNIYEYENIWQFVVDHLTSHKIRLDSIFETSPKALTPGDSIYISFYYQPQGSGNAPNSRDSLVLEFLHTPAYYYINNEKNSINLSLADDSNNTGDTVWVEDKWKSVWRAEGKTLKEFSNDTFPYFKRVMRPVIDQAYFRDDFRFRFKNYSSFPLEKTPTNYAGNRSIWNIDYIKLDYGRSVADTFYYDITFAKPAGSILKRYNAMPWSHYIINPNSHLKNNLDIAIKNLNNIEHNYSYRYHIKDEQGSIIRTYSGGTWNIAPFFQAGYQVYDAHSSPIVIENPLPTAPANKRHFQIVHIIKEGTTGDDNRRNDTITFNQIFDNYFAYDNGIPSAGYILTGSEPQSASRFILSHPDTLFGIKIFLNQTIDKQNEGPFKLMVWSSLYPEKVVYESQAIITEHVDEFNRFFTYLFEDDLIVFADTFYVGWKQTTGKEINVGYDINSYSGNNLYYNVDGKWMPSVFTGALMIRPIVGRTSDITHIKTINSPVSISLYPNPVKDGFLYVKINNNHYQKDISYMNFQIFDIHGRLIMNDKLQQTISVENLTNGVYIVRIFEQNTSEIITKKIIISR